MSLLTGAISGPADREAAFADPLDCLPAGNATEALSASVPVGRLGDPEDIGAAVVYLASEETSWVTGQTIGISGGALTT